MTPRLSPGRIPRESFTGVIVSVRISLYLIVSPPGSLLDVTVNEENKSAFGLIDRHLVWLFGRTVQYYISRQ